MPFILTTAAAARADAAGDAPSVIRMRARPWAAPLPLPAMSVAAAAVSARSMRVPPLPLACASIAAAAAAASTPVAMTVVDEEKATREKRAVADREAAAVMMDRTNMRAVSNSRASMLPLSSLASA